jgi:2-polyprenyl-3-methyl-5-hydroxy-6-metoxy-1,4-benzoquinol methylase
VLSRGERRVEATIDGVRVGATSLAFARPDVEAAVDCGTREASGFLFSCEPPDALRDRETAEIVVTVHEPGEAREIGRRRVRFSRFDYREYGHGAVLSGAHPGVLRRQDVYASGPPSPVADPRAVELITRWLRTGDRIVDVGCGIGAYGRVLRDAGFDWTGVEVRAGFVETMRGAGLRAQTFDGVSLPFGDGAFDAALCIEVLEHVEDYGPFLAELARVTRRIAFVSVPNYEALPVMARAYAIPWHMLEADHKNFFTRRGLARTLRSAFRDVEVIEYGPIESFHTPDDIPVFNHLLAIARR